MKITRFLKIKNYRIFRDFSWPRELLPFARYNLFYGWNGSGKSTLSSLFSKMQRKESQTEGEVTVEIDGSIGVLGSQFSTTHIPSVRVFNRHFIDDTLVAIKDASAKPVLYLGQQNVVDARVLEEKREELLSATNELASAIANVNDKTKSLDRYVADQARIVKNNFSGSKIYITFDKRRFIEGVKRIKDKQSSLQALSDAEKAMLERARYQQPKPDVRFNGNIGFNLNQLVDEVSKVLDQTVVSSVIEELANDPPLASWIQHGLSLHSGERHTATCRFCGNSFSDETRQRYEAHFNDSYARFQVLLGGLCGKIESCLKQLEPTFPAESEFYDNLQAEYKTAMVKAKESNDKVKSLFRVLLSAVESKKSKPFERVKVEDVLAQSAFAVADIATMGMEMADCGNAISAVVRKHNAQTLSIEQERTVAYNKLVGDFLLSAIPVYDRLKSEEEEAISKRVALQSQKDSVATQILELERRLTESRTPIEELNKELHSYLGRAELTFDIEGTGYKLLRSGVPADNLSEGECTAITFLYFLKTLSDKDFDMANGIVVIDDPVSSLDANSVFAAFAYMRERVKPAGQLFVLTHNFSFFRNVKNWFKFLNKKEEDARRSAVANFYEIKNGFKDDKRYAFIKKLDPLLEKHESEYHYLFKSIYAETGEASDNDTLERFYPLPNIARRLLDAFLSFRYPDKPSESLSQKLQQATEVSLERRTRILRFLNTYSHVDGMPMPEHDASLLSEARIVMQDVLDVIKTLDEGHYNRMVRLVERTRSS